MLILTHKLGSGIPIWLVNTGHNQICHYQSPCRGPTNFPTPPCDTRGRGVKVTCHFACRAIQKVIDTALDSHEARLSFPHIRSITASRVRDPKSAKIGVRPQNVKKWVQVQVLILTHKLGFGISIWLVNKGHNQVCHYQSPCRGPTNFPTPPHDTWQGV